MEMEMTSGVQHRSKKLLSLVRIVIAMLRKSISKSKPVVDLHSMLKRGKLAGKNALRSMMILHNHHYSASSAFGCRPSDPNLAFINPRRDHYEFSCSNSPAVSYFPNHHHLPTSRKQLSRRRRAGPTGEDDTTAFNAIQRVLEMLNDRRGGEQRVEASPLVALPGFGRSPAVRQLRITDSPFPVWDSEADAQVDKAAEEFINKFYKDLKLQITTAAAVESPFHDLWY